MSPDLVLTLLAAVLAAGTPLVLAGLGELVAERAGVLNLGLEGMMLMGAVCGFAACVESGSIAVGFAASIGAGITLSALFAALVIGFLANQVVAGLALTLFGAGLSAMIGLDYTAATIDPLPPLLAGLDGILLASLLLAAGVATMLTRTKTGLVLRAVGDAPVAAHALGYRVRLIKLGAIVFGGAMAGLAGGYLSLVYTPLWAEGMTAGRGWIALALVVFAVWHPGKLVLGAFLFGGFTIAQLHAQTLGLALPAELLSALPYLATIVAVVVLARRVGVHESTPATLGKAYHPRLEN